MGQIRREEVPLEETWDLTPIFPNFEEWEESYSILNKKVETLLNQSFTISNSTELLEQLRMYNQLLEDLDRTYSYARYKYSEDGTNSTNQKMLGMVQYLTAKAH